MNQLMKEMNAYLKKYWPRILLVVFLTGLLPGIIIGICNQSFHLDLAPDADLHIFLPWFGFNSLVSFVSFIFSSYLSLEIYAAIQARTKPRSFGFIEQIGEQGGEMFILNLLIYVKIFLWALLLIIPGIVKTLEYQRAIFLKYEHPEMKNDECFALAREQMMGKKGDLFIKGLQAEWPALLGGAIIIFASVRFIFQFGPDAQAAGAGKETILVSALFLFAALLAGLVLEMIGSLRSVLVYPFFNCFLDQPDFVFDSAEEEQSEDSFADEDGEIPPEGPSDPKDDDREYEGLENEDRKRERFENEDPGDKNPENDKNQ